MRFGTHVQRPWRHNHLIHVSSQTRHTQEYCEKGFKVFSKTIFYSFQARSLVCSLIGPRFSMTAAVVVLLSCLLFTLLSCCRASNHSKCLKSEFKILQINSVQLQQCRLVVKTGCTIQCSSKCLSVIVQSSENQVRKKYICRAVQLEIFQNTTATSRGLKNNLVAFKCRYQLNIFSKILEPLIPQYSSPYC